MNTSTSPRRLGPSTCETCGAWPAVPDDDGTLRCHLCSSRRWCSLNPVPLPSNPESLEDLASIGVAGARGKLQELGLSLTVCPFCGSPARLHKALGGTQFGRCTACGAEGPRVYRSVTAYGGYCDEASEQLKVARAAAARWNKRHAG